MKWKTDERKIKKERRKKERNKKLKVIVLKNGNIIFLLLLLCRFSTKEFFPPHFFTIQQQKNSWLQWWCVCVYRPYILHGYWYILHKIGVQWLNSNIIGLLWKPFFSLFVCLRRCSEWKIEIKKILCRKNTWYYF